MFLIEDRGQKHWFSINLPKKINNIKKIDRLLNSFLSFLCIFIDKEPLFRKDIVINQ